MEIEQTNTLIDAELSMLVAGAEHVKPHCESENGCFARVKSSLCDIVLKSRNSNTELGLFWTQVLF